MIEQGLFKRHFVGRDGFIWWIGQIASEDEWVANIPGKRTTTTSDHKGFDYRYKVRIMGYHTADNQSLTDAELPWASVMMPVTAGSGSRGASQSPNLSQGDFVYGFFLDGEDAQQPIIIGVLGHNQYTAINKNIPPIPFLPFSGFTNRDTVSRYVLTTTREQPSALQQKTPGQTGSTNNNSLTESNVSVDQGRKTGADAEQKKNGEQKDSLPRTSTCEPVPLSAIQRKIKNLIADIERIKKTASDWETKVSTKIGNIEGEIQKAIDNASEFIAGGIKWLINEVQKYTTNTINNTMKDTYYLLFPNQRPKLKKAVETANDLIACLFRKIISNLLKMIGRFLLAAVDRFINTPLCAVENFVGTLVGKLAGLIKSSLNVILAPVKSIVGAAFDVADTILSFVTDILSFLSCEEKPSCAEIKEWSIWDGSESTSTIDLDSLVNKVQDVANTVTQAIDPNSFNFDLDFTDVFDSLNSCNVGPIFCGPPIVEFYGGGGTGASGNAIIGAAGDILGVDIISSGSGYSSAPFVNFKDNCGNGSGASGRVNINNGQVTNVIIDNSGTGYLSSPNGSLGGDGRTWAGPGDTIVKRANGVYDSPYSAGSIINLNSGDTVQSCNRPVELVTNSKTITAPVCAESNVSTGDNPSTSGGDYPVVLEIGDVFISDPGFGYSNGDQIVIAPNNGSSMTAEFDNLGSLIKVNIINAGQGFTEFPDIYIQSDTGYNAKIIPIFNIKRIGNEEVSISRSARVIKVVDCVGKF
jgi:hypothetical protein